MNSVDKPQKFSPLNVYCMWYVHVFVLRVLVISGVMWYEPYMYVWLDNFYNFSMAAVVVYNWYH